MAQLLSDKELKKLFEKVIIGADENCLRPNSYIIRLGGPGAFIGAEKPFTLQKGKGVILPPGRGIGFTSLEEFDFRRETVEKIYPDCNLHAFLGPTTDLSREGLTVQSTQVDAGYHGTLNWTINNPSHQEARFFYGEKLFRIAIFRLEKDENPENPYAGDYQNKKGFVRSQRQGPPVGMQKSDWINPFSDDSPEKILENLIDSGYPWNLLGTRFQRIDSQFKTITDEYSRIDVAIQDLGKQMAEANEKLNKQENKNITKDDVVGIVEAAHHKSIVSFIGIVLVMVGIAATVYSNETSLNFVKDNSWWIGLLFIMVPCFLWFRNRSKKK